MTKTFQEIKRKYIDVVLVDGTMQNVCLIIFKQYRQLGNQLFLSVQQKTLCFILIVVILRQFNLKKCKMQFSVNNLFIS